MSRDQDIALIVRTVTDDDRDAFRELVQNHQSRVRGFLRQLTHGDHAWADDLAQETFITAYRSLARFRAESRFSTWLLGIAHNQFRNARRRQREVAVADAGHSLADNEPSHTTKTELHHDLSEALKHLSPHEQLALHLCYEQGLSHAEAAEILSWPVGTVKTHILRGKERLRTLLAAWNPRS